MSAVRQATPEALGYTFPLLYQFAHTFSRQVRASQGPHTNSLKLLRQT